MKDKAPTFTSANIVVDTREQLALDFPGSTRKGLATGDYSILGHESRMAVERKMLGDLYGCVGRERARFERELSRLSAMEYGAVVVEASLAEIAQGYEFSRVHPHSAVGSIIAWNIRFGVSFFFVGDRRKCRAFVYRILKKWWEYHKDDGPDATTGAAHLDNEYEIREG